MQNMTPQHDLEAEKSVLGAILMEPASLSDVIDAHIEAEDFYHPPHQAIYNAILDVQEAGIAIDIITVCARLKDLRKIGSCGGMAYVAALPDDVPSAANVVYYCEIVKDKSLRRQLLHKSFDLANQSQDVTSSVADIIQQYQEGLGIEQPRKAGPFLIQRAIYDLMDKIHGGFPGIDPEYDILRKTIRKLRPGTMVIVGAYTSHGKSAFAVDLVARLYRNSNPRIAIFSLEMSVDQYILRLLANETTLATWAIRENRIMPQQQQSLDDAYSHFQGKNLHIYDNLYNFTDIRKAAAEIKLKKGLDIMVIDYVQNVQCEGRTVYDRMSKLATDIFAMAKDLEITVIALSQISNESAGAIKTPIIGYKGAGEIAAAADVGIMLEKDTADDSILNIRIRKNRDGITADGVLKYAHGYTRLEEVRNYENGG